MLAYSEQALDNFRYPSDRFVRAPDRQTYARRISLGSLDSHVRRWTVIIPGLLCGVLALIVTFTNRRMFSSPLAVVVVAAIGAAAVMFQLRFHNRTQAHVVRAPVAINVVGIGFALAAVFADRFHFSVETAQLLALGAVGCFGVASAIVLHAFRKERIAKR